MDFIGVLIFIVVVILSIASKAQEARKADQREREKAEREPQQLSGKARQQIHGHQEAKVATAKRGAVPPPPPPQRPRHKPRPVEQELMETLFGVKVEKEEAQPPPQVERSTQETVQRVREAQPSGLRSEPRTTPEDVRRKQEQVRKKQAASRQKQDTARRHAHDQAKRARQKQRQRGRQREQSLHDHPYKDPPQAVPVRRKSFLFNNARDVQRAVIYAEILGPPKSTREEPTWF